MRFNKIKKLGVVNYHTYREETFNIKENDEMFLPPEKRVKI